MKIWEVVLSVDSGELGSDMVAANDYQEAIDKALKGATKRYKLDSKEAKSLYVSKVALYVETDID